MQKSTLGCCAFFSLSVWGCWKTLNLVLSSPWIRFLFTIQSENTGQLHLHDRHSLNPVGNNRGSCIWSTWSLWVFLTFYCVVLLREYYLYDTILIWFQFIKWMECVRQSVLRRPGMSTAIESIPSHLIYVIWWKTRVMQFVQRKWVHSKKKGSLNEEVQAKDGGWAAAFCLISHTLSISPGEGVWNECLAVELYYCSCVWTAVLVFY